MSTVETRTLTLVFLFCLLTLVAIPCSASVTFTSATPQIVTKGDALTLSGNGAGNGTVALWVVGKNYIDRQLILPDARGNYSATFSSDITRQFTRGQYAFVIQDPGADRRLDIEYRVDDNGDIILQNRGKTFADIGARENLKASVVPLISAFSSTAANPNSDDIFIPHYFFVEDPTISFDHIADPATSSLAGVPAGKPLVFSGQTNVNPRDALLGEIRDRSGGQPAGSVTIAVEPGTTVNRWSWKIENPRLSPGTYEVTVWRPNNFVNCSATAFFTVLPPVTETTGAQGNTTGSSPWTSDPLLPVILLLGLALVIASILYASRNR
jgi:hypothetical protein